MQIAARRVGRKVMLTCASSLSGILGNPVGPERPLDTGFVTASPLQIQITSLPPATLTLTGPGAHQALIWLGLVWPALVWFGEEAKGARPPPTRPLPEGPFGWGGRVRVFGSCKRRRRRGRPNHTHNDSATPSSPQVCCKIETHLVGIESS